jgi:uncharacterized protein (DUF1330 family)
MEVYVIASLTIKDVVRFEDYKRTVLPSMEKYGGRFVARGGPIHVLEGGAASPSTPSFVDPLVRGTHSGAPIRK